MRRRLLAAAYLALAPLVAGAQEPPAAPPAGLREAMALAAEGSLTAAVERLEALRAEGAEDPRIDAALGGLYLELDRAPESLALLAPLAERPGAPAAVLYNAWRAARRMGRGGDRLPWLERAGRLEPLSPAGRELGLLRGAEGDYARALQLLEPWCRANPDDRETRLAAALAALQLQRVPQAEELLSDLPQDEPRVRLLWGMLLFLQNDPYGALAVLKAMPEDLPAALDRDRRRTMAEAYVATGRAADAIALLEGQVGDDPALALQLSRARMQNGDPAAAAATLESFAADILAGSSPAGDPLAAKILSDYGQRLVAAGEAGAAVPYLERAVELGPEEKLAWRALGQALAASGERDRAMKALERFSELDRSETRPDQRRAELEADLRDPTGKSIREGLDLVRQQRFAEALEVARTESELAPSDPRPRILASIALRSAERYDQALAAVEEAVALAPEDADAHYERGVVLALLERVDEAIESFRVALSIGAHTPAMNDLAVLLMTREEYGEARALLERALELNPEDPVAADNLRKLEAKDPAAGASG